MTLRKPEAGLWPLQSAVFVGGAVMRSCARWITVSCLGLAGAFLPPAGAAEGAARPGASAAAPAGNAAKGRQMAEEVCGACHGLDGNSSIPSNPKLAGQHAEYLVKQLTDLARAPSDPAGRQNPVMSGFAGMLTPEDRLNVAAWFSSQTASPGVARAKEDLDFGQKLYRTGIVEKAVPACAGCHGPAGAGIPTLFPRVGGQQGDYVEAQLRAFRDGSRRNNPTMREIAFRLSDPEIKALSDYMSGLRAR
jgi:cytochrome c553